MEAYRYPISESGMSLHNTETRWRISCYQPSGPRWACSGRAHGPLTPDFLDGSVSISDIGVWNVFAQHGDPLANILLSTIGAALGLLGPGAWSVDARLFGWKRIDIRYRSLECLCTTRRPVGEYLVINHRGRAGLARAGRMVR